MCRLIAVYDFVPYTNPYWVWFDCGTAVRCNHEYFRARMSSPQPCPVHDPQGWEAIKHYADRVGVIADIAPDKP